MPRVVGPTDMFGVARHKGPPPIFSTEPEEEEEGDSGDELPSMAELEARASQPAPQTACAPTSAPGTSKRGSAKIAIKRGVGKSQETKPLQRSLASSKPLFSGAGVPSRRAAEPIETKDVDMDMESSHDGEEEEQHHPHRENPDALRSEFMDIMKVSVFHLT